MFNNNDGVTCRMITVSNGYHHYILSAVSCCIRYSERLRIFENDLLSALLLTVIDRSMKIVHFLDSAIGCCCSVSVDGDFFIYSASTSVKLSPDE